jgi:proline dehydrogenase
MNVRQVVRDGAERSMRSTLLALSHRRTVGRLATRVPITRPMVARFVAGETLDEALPALERLHAAGLRTTLDHLGEAVQDPGAATAAADAYCAAIPVLAARGVDLNVSLKLSQMGLGLGDGVARANLRKVLDVAEAAGAFVRIDMEDHTTTDATLHLWRDARSTMTAGAVGVVIQSALRRSPADVEALIADGARIRLCKGAYKEPERVAHQTRADVDAAYVALATRLLDAGTYPAIATHDPAMIRATLAHARANGIGPERFEFQMLYGVRRDLQEQLVRDGWTVRVYVPFGQEWYPYFMRRLAERPANVLFLLRSLVNERRPAT